MLIRKIILPALCATVLVAIAGGLLRAAAENARVPGRSSTLPSAQEAKARAQLLHAAMQGSLLVIHRDYFRKGESKAIPSASLKDVFKTLAEEQGVTLRWLATEETVMNVENKAQDEFERDALKMIAAGETSMEKIEGNIYRHAGSIPLQNQCLKCHVPGRTSLEDRFSALEITMAIDGSEPGKNEPLK